MPERPLSIYSVNLKPHQEMSVAQSPHETLSTADKIPVIARSLVSERAKRTWALAVPIDFLAYRFCPP
ncbi:hypothetical protein ABEF92_003867 [Exophiala dermatitidis]|uniref:Uncharacterized protein n=1 Tax=Exophiala dermatitidis (strain ATCC 34100 / CBS 525.76 / NIH/UT8656) TaxID=858893 RepID=H6BWC8_EXODN|nr:uncharacterized protein HMPREF1120_04148 [Exophiala dermatitidis NIH/UT8656]EHY56044.1 hypothetical protein HMPREF1120_04148 [Exophiala dermatitidis NIH/UT8656]